jgi:cellulose synthase/poly-beta-1,6-N-acetylglucosamine synthase-like glycosyltransferase
MLILVCAAILLLTGYTILIQYYRIAWNRIPAAQPADLLPDKPVKVSVIIPARNEATRIRPCLEALLGQSYPAGLMEIIVVDDHSTDETAKEVRSFSSRIILLDLKDHIPPGTFNAYKKKAIETGILHASGELIITTDADCRSGPKWVESLVQGYRPGKTLFVAAPVKVQADGSFLSFFEALDFISLQGITGAAVFKSLYPMCNGANLAYGRKAFFEVDGFQQIDHIASGDDMLLMGKFLKRFPGMIRYLKNPEAIVTTPAAGSWRSFFRQRVRWASKMGHYSHAKTWLTLWMVYLLNASLLAIFFASLANPQWLPVVLGLILLKTIAEFSFVATVASFFGQRRLMKYFLLCQPLHILYVVVAGAFGKFGRYTWKERTVR